MLMLLFYVGDDRYALAARQVVEIIPIVELQKLHKAPEYLAGLFNYRGQIVPAVDMCNLLQGRSCRDRLSTRIVLIDRSVLGGDRGPNLVGLIAERVTETIETPEKTLVSGVALDDAPYLGNLIADERGTIQTLQIERLLPQFHVA